MRTTQQLSITLPKEMAEAVKAKVSAGEYATESEVIRDGLRALMAQDRAMQSWLRDQVGPAYDALKADPSRAVTARQVRARLAAERAKG
ncbi:putative addiction module antidote protein, CC2985 family [Variovorax sp. CF079]|uniref:ribbon-helix-helix domain-containing protein n=1 Tax=Variovorax sp. CF079 TaxID=1882774 RepID=UPI00088B39F8|nr:type II toxin-antitoxin system ParD family antitoxin [Variovorax sp. CF079]SDE56402.1 putative addiction module antidote protein, CC2985 family [Variovorax sp. CF079]